MRRYKLAMWVVPMREYNEDPVFWSLVSATSFFARRRTIYVFFDRGPDRGVERLALGGTSQGGLYEAYHAREAIDPSIGRRPELVGQAQWDLLRKVIEERDPQTIAVDISHTHAFSDGLSAGEWEQLEAVLPERYRSRIVRAESLPLEYQEIRAPAMLPAYRRLMQVVWGTIDTAFSNRVITPGKTTTDDVAWWLRQRVSGHGAGPLIGLWDHQEGVPGRGDVSLLPNSWFSIELQATTPLPEWDNQPVRSAQEEDAELGADGQMRWILRRQTEFHVVK